ncbi:hypothetical protein D3C77_671460 [compost metagenome]
MPADFGAILCRAFDVGAVTLGVAAQRGDRQALQHDVERCLVVGQQLGHGQADAVRRHAGADGQVNTETRGEIQREGAQAFAIRDLRDRRGALNNTGEHTDPEYGAAGP